MAMERVNTRVRDHPSDETHRHRAYVGDLRWSSSVVRRPWGYVPGVNQCGRNAGRRRGDTNCEVGI